MKKKWILSAAFLTSLLPMLLHQYGGAKGVQEISGLINLLNPIGLVSVLCFSVGVWMPLGDAKAGKLLGALGVTGMVVSEVRQFFTWYVMTVTGESTLAHSIRFAFPEFYIGLAVSLAMVAAYFAIDQTVPSDEQ